MSLYHWSQTPAANATADPNINVREGMAPSMVNDGMRGIMAAMAAWRDDNTGVLDTAGTATALTVTTNQEFSALEDGLTLRLRLHVRSGLNPTLNVDALGAKSITCETGVTLDYGQLPKGSVQDFVFDAGDDAWRLVGSLPGWYVGEIRDTARATPPPGWLLCSGLTIGSAASGATARADADTELLYTVLWTDYANTELVIQTSAGAPTTRGASAAADFAANKRLPLPDLRGRVAAGQDDMGGTSANRLTNQSGGLDGDVLGASGGSETHALVATEAPAHTHSFDAGSHTHGWSHAGHTHTFSGASHTHSFSDTTSSGGAHTHTVSGTTGSTTAPAPTVTLDFRIGNSSISHGGTAAVSGGSEVDSTSGAAVNVTAGASHTHTVSGTAASNGAHTHTVSGTTGDTTATGTNASTVLSGTTDSAAVSGTTGSAGSGSAHNNVQPTWVVNKMIKL